MRWPPAPTRCWSRSAGPPACPTAGCARTSSAHPPHPDRGPRAGGRGSAARRTRPSPAPGWASTAPASEAGLASAEPPQTAAWTTRPADACHTLTRGIRAPAPTGSLPYPTPPVERGDDPMPRRPWLTAVAAVLLTASACTAAAESRTDPDPDPDSDPDRICDATPCISVAEFGKAAGDQVHDEFVGSLVLVGSDVYADGQARTAIDPPAQAMSPDVVVNTASVGRRSPPSPCSRHWPAITSASTAPSAPICRRT